MRPLILTFETYKSNTCVDIWVDNKIIVASKEIPTRWGNHISYRSEPIRKKYPTHIEVDCDGDNIYEDIYKNVPSDHRLMCFFDKKGKHQIKIRGEVPHLKAAYNFLGSVATPYSLISVDQWGDIRWKSMYEFFGDSSLTRKVSINAKDAPDLRDVCDMTRMFFGVPVFNASIENWDTSHVETMFGLFTDSTGFNQDLSRWDISSLRNAKEIFGNCYAAVICPKCDAFRVKLFNESMYRPSTFDLQLCDDLFRDVQKLKCIKGPWCSTRDKDNYKYK